MPSRQASCTGNPEWKRSHISIHATGLDKVILIQLAEAVADRLRLKGSSGGLLLRGLLLQGLLTQGHPKQMAEGSVQLSFEYYQAGRLHNLFYGLGGTYCVSFFTHCLVLSLDSTGRSLTLFVPSIRSMSCLHQAEQPRLSQAVFGEMRLLGRNCCFQIIVFLLFSNVSHAVFLV